MVLWLFHFVCFLYYGCINCFCNVWVCLCVGVCMCGIVMCGCVYVWDCNVWVSVCVGFVMCGCVYVWVV